MLVVAGKDRDELGFQGNARYVTWHQTEQPAVAQPHRCARRHRSGTRGVDDERVRKRIEHRVDIEMALDVLAT